MSTVFDWDGTEIVDAAKRLSSKVNQLRDLLEFLDSADAARADRQASALLNSCIGPGGVGALAAIGCGYFARGHVPFRSPVLVNLGCGIYVEMQQNEARKYASDSIASIENTFRLITE